MLKHNAFFKTLDILNVADASQIRYLDDNALKAFVESKQFLVVDVRDKDEYEREHIPGAENMPLATLSTDVLSKMALEIKILLHCKSGRRTKLPENMEKFLSLAGCEVFSMEEGIEQWKRCGFETVSSVEKVQSASLFL
jgi:rhodanese-related sulfurtransferase